MKASRFASLDMRGHLVIDVQGAIKAGVWADEIEGARLLGERLKVKHEASQPIPYTITDAGRALLDAKK